MSSSKLQEELKNFYKQQQKSLALVKEAKAKAPTARKPAKPRSTDKSAALQRIESEAAAAAALLPAVKVEDEAQPEQHVPKTINMKIKRVLDCLFQAQKPLNSAEILARSGIDVHERELYEELQANQSVERTGDLFEYKGQLHWIKNKEDLASYVEDSPHGISVNVLKDAYISIVDDIQALKEEHRVWVVTGADLNEEVVFPCDQKLAKAVHVDEDIMDFFHENELEKNDEEFIEQQLKKANLKPCMRAPGPAIKKKAEEEKKERQSKIRKLQNAHVLDLFKNDPAVANAAKGKEKQKRK